MCYAFQKILPVNKHTTCISSIEFFWVAQNTPTLISLTSTIKTKKYKDYYCVIYPKWILINVFIKGQ